MGQFIEERLNGKKIICWGLGRHFYSTTYDFLKESQLLSDVKLLVDSYVKTVDSERAPLLRNCPVVTPDKLKEWLDDNSIILISVADYEMISEIIESNPDIRNVEWIPDKFPIMLMKDNEILDVDKPNNTYRKNVELTIPKVINTFWFSNDPIPEKYQKCVASWKKYCPDYEIRIWSLNDYNSQGNRYFEEAISVKKWAFASDYSRIDIICRNGGIYMDLDVEVVRPIDDLLYNDAYLGFEDLEKIDCGSGFGAIKGNRVFEEIREEYKDRPFILSDGAYDQTTCPQIYTSVLERHGLQKNGSFQNVENITVYPFEFLSAKSFLTGVIYKTENTYTIHHHEGSWVSKQAKKCTESRYDGISRWLNFFQNKDSVNNCIERSEKENSEKGFFEKLHIIHTDYGMDDMVNAGSKAPCDISRIAEQCGYECLKLKTYWQALDQNDWRSIEREKKWRDISNKVSMGAVLLVQNPNWNDLEFKLRKKTITELKSEKNIKIISVVHDIEELRKIDYTDYMREEAAFMLESSNILIVHNKRMMDFYIDKGIKSERLVNLGLFDYLCKNDKIPAHSFSRDVIIAGNLSKDKNYHISDLNKLNGVSFRLFGKGYERQGEDKNIKYEGAVDADDLPDRLPDGFGLVWGGDSLEGCTGNAGEYLRYNAPHKLSLYLAAGLPVIIWSGAAMADFVIENEVGFVVSSLYELKDALDRVTEADYKRFAENAAKIGVRLRNGEYTKAAIREAERRLGMSESK